MSTQHLTTTIRGEQASVSPEILEKYSRPGPRYTSYPTIPHWNEPLSPQRVHQVFEAANSSGDPLSFYFHIPFCEQRCTFCGCNVIATKKHDVAHRYLACLLKEIQSVAKQLSHRTVSQIHFGGGTPNYLTPEQLGSILQTVRQHFDFTPHREIAIEIDPRQVTTATLDQLVALGMNRFSFGVQDIDPQVQEAIGRIQPLEQTQAMIEHSRSLGITSVHCDLVYGLPHQHHERWVKSLEALIALAPDRLSLFQFAYLPSLLAHQRKIDPESLASSTEKMRMLCSALTLLQEHDYFFIGLDHFVKTKNELFDAYHQGKLIRNFQGYATQIYGDLVGCGMTAIGQVGDMFLQNKKQLIDYERSIEADGLAPSRGMLLNTDDRIRQWVIEHIFCRQYVDKSAFQQQFGQSFDDYFANEQQGRTELIDDGLIQENSHKLNVTAVGQLFLRNIAMVFDAYLHQSLGMFSKTA